MGVDPGPLNDDVPALRALVGGCWARWGGLQPLPTADEVATQLGAPLDEAPIGGVFAGSPTMFRRYGAGDAAAAVTVWFENDLAVAVQVDGATRAAGDDPLPEPDVELESGFGEGWRQLAFGEHGLVVHVPVGGELDSAALVFGLPPFTADEFRSDPVRHLGGERRLR